MRPLGGDTAGHQIPLRKMLIADDVVAYISGIAGGGGRGGGALFVYAPTSFFYHEARVLFARGGGRGGGGGYSASPFCDKGLSNGGIIGVMWVGEREHVKAFYCIFCLLLLPLFLLLTLCCALYNNNSCVRRESGPK